MACRIDPGRAGLDHLRALCDLFDLPVQAGKIVFRGDTAISELPFRQSLRYSDDVDVVPTPLEPVGTAIDAIPAAPASWVGNRRRHQAGRSVHLVFKFVPEVNPEITLKILVPITFL